MNRRAQLACVWCGPACAILFALGAGVLARWIPPYIDANDSAAQVAQVFQEHTDRIRVGTLLAIISMSLVAPWGLLIASQIRRLEGDFPILTYLMVASAAIGTTIVICMCTCWAVASFRPTETDPQIMQAMNDLGYFFFLFTAFPFVIWAGAMAYAVLADDSDDPVYPRWLGYLSLWTALLFFPADLIIFFKEGPFAWQGLMALYVPVAVFFIWFAGMSVCTYRNIKHRGLYFEGRAKRPTEELVAS